MSPERPGPLLLVYYYKPYVPILVSIDFLGKLANGCHDWNRKLVIIGDGACGKTSLLSVFTLGYFPTVSDGLSSSFV